MRQLHAGVGPAVVTLAILTFCAGCATETRTDFDRGTVFGLVLDEDGRPVAGAELRIGRRTASCDSFGRFRLTGLRPGGARLSASAPGHEAARAPITVLNRAVYVQVRLMSVSGLVERAIEALHRGDRAAAFALHQRIEELAPDDARSLALSRLLGVTP